MIVSRRKRKIFLFTKTSPSVVGRSVLLLIRLINTVIFQDIHLAIVSPVVVVPRTSEG